MAVTAEDRNGEWQRSCGEPGVRFRYETPRSAGGVSIVTRRARTVAAAGPGGVAGPFGPGNPRGNRLCGYFLAGVAAFFFEGAGTTFATREWVMANVTTSPTLTRERFSGLTGVTVNSSPPSSLSVTTPFF